MARLLTPQWSWLVALLLLTGACAGSVRLPDGSSLSLTSAEFRDYVADTFKYQNSVADRLGFAILDAYEPDAARQLETTERQLELACAGINELAVAARDGVQLPPLKRRRLARQVVDCRRAAEGADQVLAGSR